VAQALAGNLWMRGLRRMSTDQELRQCVSLRQSLQQVQLDERPDQITWRFTADGNYTVKSAYNVQFIGSFPDHDWEKVWKAKVEPKCRFFLLVVAPAKDSDFRQDNTARWPSRPYLQAMHNRN